MSETAPPSKQGRFAHLDSIRGFAALAVLFFHCIWHIVLAREPDRPFNAMLGTFISYFDFGKSAVVLLFAMSGFVIPFTLLRSKRRPLTGFLISRFFRLYPLYWVSLLLGVGILWGWTAPLKMVLVNVTMIQGFVRVPDVLGVYWTLQIELCFYFVCSVFLLTGVVRKTWPSLASLIVFLIIAVGFAYLRYTTGAKFPVALPLGLAVMFWGDLVRRASESEMDKRWEILGFFLLLAALVPVCLLAYDSPQTGETWYRYLITYALSLVLFRFWANSPNWTNWPLASCGKISYSIYLIHPVVLAIDRVTRGFLDPWTTSAIVVVVTIGVSIVTYRLVEKPAILLGVRLRSKYAD